MAGPTGATPRAGGSPGCGEAAAVRPGTLYVVGTPIGNLRDITLRALEVLRGVDVIAAEDTRRTRALCEAHGIAARLVSYHAHNADRRADALCARLGAGEAVALVSDAGMPILSDPGAELVARAAARGHPVVVIPGPSAAIAALAGSGFASDAVVFGGFVPRRPAEREAFWRAVAADGRVHVLFEAPHRLRASLKALAAAAPDRRIALARELTKVHEEFVRGTAAEVLAALDARFGGGRVAGECTLVIAGAPGGPPPEAGAVRGGDSAPADAAGIPPAESDRLARAVEDLVQAGLSLPDAVKRVARASGVGRRTVYRAAVARRESPPPGGARR